MKQRCVLHIFFYSPPCRSLSLVVVLAMNVFFLFFFWVFWWEPKRDKAKTRLSTSTFGRFSFDTQQSRQYTIENDNRQRPGTIRRR